MKKKFWPFVLLLGWMFAGCAGAEEVEEESIAAEMSVPESAVQEESSAFSGESETAPEEPSRETPEKESSGTDGGMGMCQEHTAAYHSIPYDLIRWIGTDAFYDWVDTLPYETDEFGRPDEDFTIVEVVEQFNVPKETFWEITRGWMTDEAMENMGMTAEEYIAQCGYSDAQIDAIYSGDQSRINEAFCGDLAYYNPSDGQLYSIYWLSDHTAADYQAAGVPVSEVERILDGAAAMGGSYASLAEAAAPAAEAYALE